MSIRKTLGGERIGSGNKMTVRLKNYERSTSDISRVWKSSMAVGTLIPSLRILGLNGDTFKIKIREKIITLPTVAPLFGTFKFQTEIYVCPMRLYNAQLHNNKLGIGLNMKKVMLPMVRLQGPSVLSSGARLSGKDYNTMQINPSSLMSYLGVRGLGHSIDQGKVAERSFNAMPLLMYWDIIKNYYINKQEERGYYLAPRYTTPRFGILTYANVLGMPEYMAMSNVWGYNGTPGYYQSFDRNVRGDVLWNVEIGFNINTAEICYAKTLDTGAIPIGTFNNVVGIRVIKAETIPNELTRYTIQGSLTEMSQIPADANFIIFRASKTSQGDIGLITKDYLTSNIDEMRERILKQADTVPLYINTTDDDGGDNPDNGLYGRPYCGVNKILNEEDGPGVDPGTTSSVLPMAGIALKTYLSDRFNNWLNTEWIDGENGITEITKIDVTDGLKLDTLNLMQKVYNMLNRIAVSGGSYNDWQEAVFGEETARMAESPIYVGGMSTEITFGEVIASTAAENQPLGELAGKGRTSGGEGYIEVKIKEPSIIIAISSLTPRLDYSQGNDWINRLITMDDMHKPQLDGIGFQELITDEIAAFDTECGSPTQNKLIYKSAGKQTAWIEYTTAVNETYGTFAEKNNAMFMTLNRKYESAYDPITKHISIKDLTTYIDPKKYNYAFAHADRDAQNFWVQLGYDITKRSKIAVQQIPNL